MDPTRRQKKLLLFLSSRTPLWAELLALEKSLPRGTSLKQLLLQSPFESEPLGATQRGKKVEKVASEKHGLQSKPGPREHHLDVSHETIRKWSRQEFDSAPHKDAKALDHLCHALALLESALVGDDLKMRAHLLRGGVKSFREKLVDESADLYACGHCLGMGRAQTQQAIDTIIHSESPLLSLAYYRDEQAVKGVLGDLGGLYYAWLERPDKSTKKLFWMQCALQVRYIIRVGELHLIRCKLLIPNLVADNASTRGGEGSDIRPFWHYDGFIRNAAPKTYWIFEKRQSPRQDFMFFVSEQSGNVVDDRLTISGGYLTSGQDVAQSIVSGRAIFHRVSAPPSSDDEASDHADLMRKMPRRLSASDPGYKMLKKVLTKLN